MSAEAIDIAVLVRDRVSTFPKCLDALYAATHLPFRIIVVVGGADLATRIYLDGVARRRENLRVIYRDSVLREADARRLALGSISAARCVLMENDSIVHPGWLRPLLDAARQERAAIVMPLVLWHRGVHAAGCNFEVVTRDGSRRLEHSIEYVDIRRRRIGYAETHCMLVDLDQLTTSDLCDEVEPSDVDLGLTLRSKGCTAVIEPRSVITYAAPPPNEVRDIEHSLDRWSLDRWCQSHERFVAKWNLHYDASAKHASYRRQALRLALVRRHPTAAAVAITNFGTRIMNGLVTAATSGRARRTFG
jgi:GT2 family glycosyltransferase